MALREHFALDKIGSGGFVGDSETILPNDDPTWRRNSHKTRFWKTSLSGPNFPLTRLSRRFGVYFRLAGYTDKWFKLGCTLILLRHL